MFQHSKRIISVKYAVFINTHALVLKSLFSYTFELKDSMQVKYTQTNRPTKIALQNT